ERLVWCGRLDQRRVREVVGGAVVEGVVRDVERGHVPVPCARLPQLEHVHDVRAGLPDVDIGGGVLHDGCAVQVGEAADARLEGAVGGGGALDDHEVGHDVHTQ